VPVHHFHRAYGTSQFFNFRRLFAGPATCCCCGMRSVVAAASRADVTPLADRAADPSNRVYPARPIVTVDYREFYPRPRVDDYRRPRVHRQQPARSSVRLGADVLLVDSLIPDYGGNLFNIDGIADRVARQRRRHPAAVDDELLVRDRDVIFKPGRTGQPHRQHARSVHRPRDQLPQQLTVLEACRNHNPRREGRVRRHASGLRRRIACRSTRRIWSTDRRQRHQQGAGEYYHLVYNNVFGVRGLLAALRPTSTVRAADQHNRQGFIGWFIRLAVENQTSSDLRRRLSARATSSTSTMPPTRSCARRQRLRATASSVQRRRRSADQPSAS
jgi:hypothetical protein